VLPNSQPHLLGLLVFSLFYFSFLSSLIIGRINESKARISIKSSSGKLKYFVHNSAWACLVKQDQLLFMVSLICSRSI
jgi:TctA family transporter